MGSRRARKPRPAATAEGADLPLISCVMLTADRPEFMLQSAALFNRQTYPRRELIIVDAGAAGAPQIPTGEQIRYFRLPPGLSAGDQLAYALSQARGEFLTLWDDAAWSAEQRLAYQLAPLLDRTAAISALSEGLRMNLRAGQFHRSASGPETRTAVIRTTAWEQAGTDFHTAVANLLKDAKQKTVLGNEGMWIAIDHEHNTAGTPVADPPLPPADKAFYARYVRKVKPRRPARAPKRHRMVSCIMPTANRRAFLPHAIRLFQQQDYVPRELVILDDGDDPVGDLIPDDPSIRYFRLTGRRTVGAKRNLACEYAAGEFIVHWDDDDYSAPSRIRLQVEHLLQTGADICGLSQVYFAGPDREQAWIYRYGAGDRPWVCGGTFCYWRTLWERNRFTDDSIGEDNGFVWSDVPKTISAMDDNSFYLATIHPANTSPKYTADSRWNSVPVDHVRAIAGESWPELATLLTGRAGMLSSRVPRGPESGRDAALVTLGAGIGDIIRVTPLIRVMESLGYEVDVAVETDYPESVSLLEGAPEIRTLFHRASPWAGHGGSQNLEALSAREYAIAVHPPWTYAGQFPVAARRTLSVPHDEWINRGIAYAVETLAEAAGWRGPLPGPIAMGSGRNFDLPEGTIALHPGCKPGWYWKKWHGFEELATMFPNVAIVGTPDDLRNGDTYFGRTFAWPDSALYFVGNIGLKDTASLLSQCRALISNDSGLMHLGAAVGVPVFGIFGITSPAREAMPFPNLFPITKQLPCEPACRLQPARRECEHNLRCLQTLTPAEVFARVESLVPKSGAVPQARYEERYFESGGTGGWEDGYHWHILGEFYEKLGTFLTGCFPSGESFLDAACGKGFLVRVLRRAGRECWGFDTSKCAVAHAVDGAREWIELASVDGYRFDRPFDVLLLLDMLDHLTPEQARGFLVRARRSTSACAVVALDPGGTLRHDRARITRRPAAWWHELFLQAGWKKDHLHRALEQRWQAEAHRAGIDWEIAIYAP